MEEKSYFSVWFGSFENQELFNHYINVIYPIFSSSSFDPDVISLDIPEEHVHSGFIDDFDLDSCKYTEDYDEDFGEFMFYDNYTSDYKELLKDFSYYDDIIGKILDVTSLLNNEKFNCALVLYNYRYQQPTKKNVAGNVVFIGAFSYEP